MTYDLVIRNGTVVDGSGLASYRADVAVLDGRIARIGRMRDPGRQEIDAEGHVVTPGFIDGHTHMDAQVFWDPLGSCSCWHGVTTVVMGHCGFTLAPAPREQRHLVVRNLERAEDISGDAMAAGIDWTWTTFAEYLDVVDRLPKGINYAANIGHSALRTYAMGERAFDEPAGTDDLAAMERELRDALGAGAYGFTTSRTHHHETSDDRPVASRLASWDEVRRLVLAMGDAGAGIFQLVEDPPDADERAERDARLVRLAVEAGVPVAIGATGSSTRALELLDAAHLAGGRMFGLTHCRGIGTMSSFRTQLPFDSLPEWREVRALPFDELRVALRDPDVRKRLVWAAYHGAYARALGGQARRPDFDRMQILARPVPPHQTVAEVARARGVDPVELMIDLALDTDFDQFFVQTNAPFDHEGVKAVMRHPRTVMAFSDAGAHVSQMSDCSIQTHLLAHWVRDRQDFTLEEAVRMMTLAAARAWGFHDRGLLREGLVADINVFDAERVGPDLPTVAHDLPAGAPRLKQTATGFLATIVAGEVVHDRGAHTGALPGRLIRGPLAAHSNRHTNRDTNR
ncbi:MAG TPA: amidohydrolase family protein [Acidimicrobiales bacterium]|jgi:N-acyl-D-aspartate/D-glutamate deacylase|nr:amidohydrolase family protein [Acidimicrobiales bacterium]